MITVRKINTFDDHLFPTIGAARKVFPGIPWDVLEAVDMHGGFYHYQGYCISKVHDLDDKA